MRIRMIATTRRIWMNPPMVYDVTRPSAQRITRMTAIVVSICRKLPINSSTDYTLTNEVFMKAL